MRKSKQNDFEKIVSSKAKEKAKDLAQKLQSREELASLAKPDIKETSNLNSASKKIQKEALQPVRGNPKKKQLKPKLKKEKKPKLLPEGQAPAKAVIVPLDIKRYGEFVKTQNNKYMRIRKRTIETLKFDKNQIKKATKSLLSFFEKQKSQNQHFDKREDFIYLEITLNLAPPQYNVRPIQMYFSF